MGLEPSTKDTLDPGARFPHVLFSAPPSGSSDYVAEVRGAGGEKGFPLQEVQHTCMPAPALPQAEMSLACPGLDPACPLTYPSHRCLRR